MRFALVIMMALAVTACTSRSQERETDSSAKEPTSINELADQLDLQMNRGWEARKSDIQELARGCGTSIVFHDDELVVVNDQPYAWWIAPSATPQQINCVHRQVPDVPTAPR
jgi:hypothetical protein